MLLPPSTAAHTHTFRNPLAAARLTPSPTVPTSLYLHVVARAGAGRWMAVPQGCRCYGEWKWLSQRAGDSDEGESGRLPPSANNTASAARSRHLVTVWCGEIQPRFPKCSASLRNSKLQRNIHWSISGCIVGNVGHYFDFICFLLISQRLH